MPFETEDGRAYIADVSSPWRSWIDRDAGEFGQITLTTPTGRTLCLDALRCKLIEVDGRRATVRVGRDEVTVHVLGDWQLAGRTEPEEAATDGP